MNSNLFLEKAILKNKDEEIQALKDQIGFKSLASPPETTKDGNFMPFGEGVGLSYKNFLDLGKSMGFKIKDIDGYGGHIEWGEGDEILGILGHLDVVPEGDGWEHPPFAGDEEGDFIYGRGTTDDKGPMVASLYAMKALKESGHIPDKRVRLIIGLDEETNWKGIEYYFQKEERPTIGFTPDGEFPVINGEKGILFFSLAKKLNPPKGEGLYLKSLKGGNAPNMVPESARAVVNHKDRDFYNTIREKAKKFNEETGYKIKLKGIGKALEITTSGISAHGAHPELGKNAVTILMDFLGKFNFHDESLNEFLDFYNNYIGYDFYGEKIGCNLEDEISGKLVLNVGTAEMEKEAVTLGINVRYPVTAKEKDFFEPIDSILNEYNLGIIKHMHQPPIYFDEDNYLVKTLLDVYRDNTGDIKSKPLTIGGGTYARATANIVAFGGAFPGDEDRMHQKDERIAKESLLLMTKIYSDAIYRLSGGRKE